MVTLRWTVVWFSILIVGYVLPDSYSYDYNYDTDDTYDQEGRTRKCFSCEYGMERGEVIGSEECGWDFDPIDLAHDSCEGSCAIDMERSKTDPDHEFIVHRYCAKNCHEVNNSSRRIQCCYSDLCNRGGFHLPLSWANSRSPFSWIFIFFLALGHLMVNARFREC